MVQGDGGTFWSF